MSTTKAKKLRNKRIREGKYDPTNQRRSWNGVIPIERTTLTRKEAEMKLYKKQRQKWNLSHTGDDSIFCWLKPATFYLPMFSIGATRPYVTLGPCVGAAQRTAFEITFSTSG